MAQSYISLWYHLIWSTKNREPFIKKEWKSELYNRMKNFCKQKEYYLDYVNGIDDHLHLLISPKPVFAISDIVRNIKTDSYYWLKESGFTDEAFGWQDGYAAFTVSPSQIKSVRKYIQNQEVHHVSQSFQEELKLMKTLQNN